MALTYRARRAWSYAILLLGLPTGQAKITVQRVTGGAKGTATAAVSVSRSRRENPAASPRSHCRSRRLS